jgi:Uma2 family endonuclease
MLSVSESPLHGTIASLLQDALTPQLPAGVLLRREEPLTLRESEPEPDLAVATGARRDYLRAIEVAVTSPEDDRALAEIYAEAGVGEFRVVLAKERAIEVFRQPEGFACREMRRYEFADELVCGTVPGVKFVLAELFAGISAGVDCAPAAPGGL